MNKKSVKIIVSFAISAILVLALGWQLDWNELKKAFGEIQYIALIPTLAVFALHYVLRAWRWGAILPESDKGTLRQRLDSLMVGNLASFVLPLRAGEFIRPLLYRQYSGTPFALGFSSVVLERVFDLLTILLTFWLLVFFIENFPPEVFIGASALGTMGALLVLFFVIGAIFEERLERLIAFVLKIFPKKLAAIGEKVSSDLLKAALILRSPKRLFSIVMLTLLVWASSYLSFQTFFWLFGMNPNVLVSVTVAVVVALAVAAPSAPGFIGVYQWAWVAGLALFGMDAELAAAISIVSHALNYIVFLGYGGYVLMRDNISLTELSKKQEDNPSPL